MNKVFFHARAARALEDGSDREILDELVSAYHLCQALSQLQDQLKRRGLATAQELLDGTVRIVSIAEEREGDVRVAFTEAATAASEGMASTMERMA